MVMLALKSRLFSELEDSMRHLKDHGFTDRGLSCASVRTFGDFAFLRDEHGADSTCLTAPCRVLSAVVNQHDKGDKHVLTIELDPAWIEALKPALKAVCQKVFATPDALALATAQASDVDMFWRTCALPFYNNTLSIRESAFTKRGHKKQYINIFDVQGKEKTGQLQIYTGGRVAVSLGFYMYENMRDDQVMHGMRAKIVHGIQVLETGGPPPLLKQPWSWHDVDFSTMKIDTHGSFEVRMPPLRVVSHDATSITLDVEDKPEFKAALAAFYTLAQCDWSGKYVQLASTAHKQVTPGALAIVCAAPSKTSSNTIEWSVRKLHCHRAKAAGSSVACRAALGQTEAASRGEAAVAVGRKRQHGDTSDTLPGAQTKMKCR
jgi:hypothetical protein|tara:strand:- start:86 stop:1216 length:1131 start_codon:yes stop_codon:yes gene_type:complete